MFNSSVTAYGAQGNRVARLAVDSRWQINTKLRVSRNQKETIYEWAMFPELGGVGRGLGDNVS